MLDRPLRPGVRVLNQLDNLDRETRVEEFLQLVEGYVHTKRPLRRLAVVDKAAAAERAFHTLPPFANIDRGTRRSRSPHGKAFTERLVPAGLLDHQLNEPRPIEGFQIGADLVDYGECPIGRFGKLARHDKCDRDTVLTKHSLRTDRTIT